MGHLLGVHQPLPDSEGFYLSWVGRSRRCAKSLDDGFQGDPSTPGTLLAMCNISDEAPGATKRSRLRMTLHNRQVNDRASNCSGEGDRHLAHRQAVSDHGQHRVITLFHLLELHKHSATSSAPARAQDDGARLSSMNRYCLTDHPV